MKILIPLLILIFTLTAFSQTVKVTALTALVRTKPNLKAKVLKVVKAGELLELKRGAYLNGWYSIDLSDREQGWILSSKVRFLAKKEITVVRNDWFAYARSKTGNYFYDGRRIKSDSGIYQVWTQEREAPRSKVVSAALYEINCSDGKLRSIAGTDYASGTGWSSPDEKFIVFSPDSTDGELYKKICGK